MESGLSSEKEYTNSSEFKWNIPFQLHLRYVRDYKIALCTTCTVRPFENLLSVTKRRQHSPTSLNFLSHFVQDISILFRRSNSMQNKYERNRFIQGENGQFQRYYAAKCDLLLVLAIIIVLLRGQFMLVDFLALLFHALNFNAMQTVNR